MSDIENIFVLNVLKGKYTFSKLLFSQSIEDAFKEEPELACNFSQKYYAKNFTGKELSETYQYIVPIVIKEKGGIYEVN
jgi:hypothetical protein